MKIEAIDLFCGIGGLTYGLEKAGIDVLLGLDNDPSCEYSFTQNNSAKFLCTDVREYDFSNLIPLFSQKSKKVIVGCAPCQPFSSHSHKIKSKENDERWNLIEKFIDAVKIVKPEVISMENVRGLAKTKIFHDFLHDLGSMGYHVDYKIIFTPDYGIPQNRFRLVLLGSLLGPICIPPPLFNKDNYPTVREKIYNLPKIDAGGVDSHDRIHRSKALSELNIKRIHASKPGGSWRDWDKRLLPDCYRKPSGASYSSVYGRMQWNGIAPTITTQFVNYGSGRFGHPEQDRALSIREGSILQSFPHSYAFNDKLPIATLARQIGNAVPPDLGAVIGKQIIHHFNEVGNE